MLRQFLLSAALGFGSFANAAPLEITYSSVVIQSVGGAGAPTVGDVVTGVFTFDSSPEVYNSCIGAPQTAEYQARCLAVAPYGSSIRTPTRSVSSSSMSLEVLDNNLSGSGVSTPGDLVSFSSKRSGLFYSLMLFGPTSAFAGTAVPTETLLLSLLPGAVLYAQDDFVAGGTQTFLATVTSLAVSPVPEPPALLLLTAGLALLAARVRTRGDA